jgi:hypothetical protein
VHHQKVVKIKKVESGQAKGSGNRRFQVTMLLNELVMRAFDADAQVDGGYDRAVDEYRLGAEQ